MKTLNAHKIAWQMLHAELRRRMRPDSGMPGLDESETFAPAVPAGPRRGHQRPQHHD